MRKVFALIALLAAVLPAAAKSLVIELADGTEVYYLIKADSWPVMTVNDKSININTDQYEFSHFAKFRISDTDAPTAVNTVKTGEVDYQDGKLCISGTDKKVVVYDTKGIKVKVEMTTAGDMTVVNTGALKQGAYIIQTGTSSLKIIKK